MSHTTPHRTLGAITNRVDGLKAISKAALRFGDRVFAQTLNSTYSIQVLKSDQNVISGGWFDKEGLSPLQTTISGCTFGGSAIKVDIVAADGLHRSLANESSPAGFAGSMWVGAKQEA